MPLKRHPYKSGAGPTPAGKEVVHLRKDDGRVFTIYCRHWHNATMSPNLSKVTCKRCLQAYAFIGPIHPRAGQYNWKTGDRYPGHERPWERPTYQEAQELHWRKNHKGRVIEL